MGRQAGIGDDGRGQQGAVARDRSKLLPGCVIWSAASAPEGVLAACAGVSAGSRATRSGAGSDSPGWTSTRAILRGGRAPGTPGRGSLFRAAVFMAAEVQSILLQSAWTAAGSGVLGVSFGALGIARGAGASVLGSGNSSPFCRTMARASDGLASGILAASGRRMSNGPLALRASPAFRGAISTLGVRGISAAAAKRSISRGWTWAAGGACSRMVVVTACSNACSGCCSSSCAQ